ncbi:MAG TPA: RNA polymerase-binding protein RbpA [Mycobacteriales bacterium]|nr:RNA polymerase-binding protein RbpA [Mycobacteriales bacterium]
MSDRVLRGSRLGAISYETDRNTELAPRSSARYDCPKGHHFSVPFAAEAEVPASWECRQCGAVAILSGGPVPEPKKVKPARTHMDMLRERRTTADLEEVLKEQLAVHTQNSKKKKSA